MSSTVAPPESSSRMSSTVMRVPVMTGLPNITAGSEMMRPWYNWCRSMICLPVTRSLEGARVRAQLEGVVLCGEVGNFAAFDGGERGQQERPEGRSQHGVTLQRVE